MKIFSLIKNKISYTILLLFFLLHGCRNDRSKEKLKVIIPLCGQRLFAEKYQIWGGGAHDGDIISAYLTDSTNFRIYLRTYDNAHEGIGFECKGDSIIVSYGKNDAITTRRVIVDSTIFSLSDLKKKNIFE